MFLSNELLRLWTYFNRDNHKDEDDDEYFINAPGLSGFKQWYTESTSYIFIDYRLLRIMVALISLFVWFLQ